jgi:glycosyltransferase involved in cell wall biosynthesis
MSTNGNTLSVNTSHECYIASAIISTYNAEKFFRGCLQNLIDQTLYIKGQLQIIIINSGSDQDEESIAREFMARYGHIIYRRTKRETLYAAWNRGIELASGRYLTHANTDDRHCPNAFELMAQALEQNDVGLVYVDALITRGANETFNYHFAKKAWLLPDFNIRQAILDCPFGCQVMWRRSAHFDVGMFDASYKRAGDYEFFLRLAIRAGALHLPKILALYHESPNNLSYQAPEEVIQEVNRFIITYRRHLPLEFIYPYLQEDSSPTAQAAAMVDFANNLMGSKGFLFKDTAMAEMLYRGALEILPSNPDVIGNLIIACLLNNKGIDAISLIQSACCLTPRLAYYRDAFVHGKTPVFTLTSIDYPGLSAMPPIKTARDIRVPLLRPTRHGTDPAVFEEEKRGSPGCDH